MTHEEVKVPRDDALADRTVASDSLLIAREPTHWIDRWAQWIGDSLSPILIKEARQVLKSRQFLWTFFLLLAAVALWTLVGWSVLSAENPDRVGIGLLYGYLLMLGFPLGIIVPFAAYRSMAGEFENGTIQLISVTTMTSWQIVLGKLGSAVLQIIAYWSVLAPCIAFTYLLRGISVGQIMFAVSFCVVASLVFCCAGLFFACAIRSRVWSTGVGVLFVLALGAVISVGSLSPGRSRTVGSRPNSCGYLKGDSCRSAYLVSWGRPVCSSSRRRLPGFPLRPTIDRRFRAWRC